MNFTRFFVAAPIVLTTLYTCSLPNTHSSNASASPKARTITAQTVVSNTTNANCNYYHSCPQKD
jgi:hypothetical protein